MPLLAAGYVVAAPTARPTWMGAGVPDPFLTVSPCLTDELVVPEFSGWFQDLDEAVSATHGGRVLGVALEQGNAERFLADFGEDRHFALLHQGVRVDVEPLGFEVVGAEYSLSLHSWHCHDLAPAARAELGIGLTDLGLLASQADADRVLAWMLAQPPAGQPAPVPWTVVALWWVSPGSPSPSP